eukprot:gene9138-9910_t
MTEFLSVHLPEVYAPIAVGETSPKERWDDYQRRYKDSTQSNDEFWRGMADKYLSWFTPFQQVRSGHFIDGDIAWFAAGRLNASFNCIDRHLASKGDQVAIIWEGDEIGETRKITYNELHRETCKIANVLKSRGVKKGDVVTIYMPMIPETAMTILACARIGAVHSVVFAGFSADSLRDRLLDCDSRFLVTTNQGRRGGKVLALKHIADNAVKQCPDVDTVFVFRYPNTEVDALGPKDLLVDDELPKARPYCPCESMDSEDTLFILYTSGSTGKPKGVAHTTAGYLLNAALTTENSFDIKPNDVYCCVADVGWITGHTYIIYGPLCLGTTTVMFESVPTHPHAYRYWDLVQTHKITQFYTAPTAIRALMRHSASPIAQYDLSSLRVIGTVGEPINPEAWKWYFNNVGRGKCTLVDTYWQTETGGHVCSNFHGVTPMKPGSCTVPYYGIQFAIVDPQTGKEVFGNGVEGVLCIKEPWPSIARTVYGDHDRYLNVYMKPYPGFYFTGDGARRDKDGYYWITGRVDDVINPSGHRIGTAEIESALVACPEVAESAVIGFPHEIKGEGIGCFVILREGYEGSDSLTASLKAAVRSAIGPIATPDFIVYSDLPKTRSGKIMRRILRKIAAGEEDSIGDITTLADPSVVQRLINKFREAYNRKSSSGESTPKDT